MKSYLPILPMLLLALLLLPAASSSLGTFKQYQEVNVVTILNGTASSNLTIYYPNNTAAINVLMQKQGSRFNYTFVNTNTLGIYNYDYFDDVGNVYVNDFVISGTGTNLSIGQAIIYFIFLAAAIGVFILCLFYAVKIPWQNDRDEDGFILKVNDMKYLKLSLWVFCYIILLFISGLMRGITANFIPELGVTGFFEWIYWILLSIMYPLIVCSLIFALMIFLTNKKLKKALEKGIPTE